MPDSDEDRRVGHQLAQAEVDQMTEPRTTDHGLPNQTEHRHPHPERVQSRGVPVVGERVETEVETVISLQGSGLTSGSRLSGS